MICSSKKKTKVAQDLHCYENDHLNIGVMQTSNQDWKDRTKDTMWIASEILEPQYATL